MTKRILATLLAMLLLLGMTACDSILNSKNQKALVGYWKDGIQCTEEENRKTLENLDFYEDEIALCDLSATNYLHYYVRFNEDGTFEDGIDFNSTKTSMMAYLSEYCFPRMYEGRAELGDLYGVDLTVATEDEFKQFYADLYEKETYYDLLVYLSEVASDYTSDAGTYRVKGDKIYFTEDGEEEYATFELNEGVDLTIQYNDMTIYYRPAIDPLATDGE